MTALPFDTVIVRREGREERMSAPEFLRLSLPLRVRVIMERTVEFYANGKRLDRSAVLRELRARTATQ